jgi:hypothetical protein
MDEQDTSGRIVIESHRKWFGDQRLGTFVVSLDGTSAGKLPPEGRVELRCASGVHVVRIRQWWYRSKPTEVQISIGQTVSLRADIPRTGSVLNRMTTFIATPWRALSLTEIR